MRGFISFMMTGMNANTSLATKSGTVIIEMIVRIKTEIMITEIKDTRAKVTDIIIKA
jgi:hypothetical protein